MVNEIERYNYGRCYGSRIPIYIYCYDMENGYLSPKAYEYYSGRRHYCAKLLNCAQKNAKTLNEIKPAVISRGGNGNKW